MPNFCYKKNDKNKKNKPFITMNSHFVHAMLRKMRMNYTGRRNGYYLFIYFSFYKKRAATAPPTARTMDPATCEAAPVYAGAGATYVVVPLLAGTGAGA